jgi:hypothetical protein
MARLRPRGGLRQAGHDAIQRATGTGGARSFEPSSLKYSPQTETTTKRRTGIQLWHVLPSPSTTEAPGLHPGPAQPQGSPIHTRKPNGRGGGPGGSQSQQSHCALAVLNDTEPNTAIAANNKKILWSFIRQSPLCLVPPVRNRHMNQSNNKASALFRSADTLMMT